MKKNIGKLLAGLIVVVVLAAIFMRGDQLEHLIQTIERGTPYFLFLAVACQLMKYFCQAASFLWCFKAVNAKVPYKACVKLVFQTFFLDTVIPSLNISGTTATIEEASHFGIEPGRSTGAALLRQITISAGFIVVMVVGFALLWIIGGLKMGWVILGLVAILVVGVMVAAMVLAAAKPDLVLRIAAPIERIVDKVLAHFKKDPIDDQVKKLVQTYASSAQLMAKNRSDILIEFGFAVLGNVFEVANFWFVGLAFGMNNLEAVICVYVVATLFAMMSPIPQGVGVVEGASLVAFTLFGIEQATGMAVIMVYRTIVFWLPFLVGAVVMQRSGMSLADSYPSDS